MSKILTIIIVYACISYCSHINMVLNAQHNFILNEHIIEEYDLITQVNYYWQISADSSTDRAIKQKWRDSEKEVYYILYCEFANEAIALQGSAFMANSCALPFIKGSPTGKIYGDNSWVAIDGSAVCFHIGKYGIKIFKPINFQQDDRKKMKMFSNQIIKQIEESSIMDSGDEEILP